MEYATRILSALSDPLRLRAIALIAEETELCVCELTQALQASQPAVSKHMAVLRDAGLVRDRRNAQWVLYSLAPDLPGWTDTLVRAAVEGVGATENHAADRARLRAASRPPRRLLA